MLCVMDEAEPDLISDPKRLRALAHPLRWQLIELIGAEGSATATRCAEALGQTVANCSYHLNTLAKYGFVEHADAGDSRVKPWRLTSYEQSFSADGADPESTLAAVAAGDAFLENEVANLRDRIMRKSLEPPEWRHGTGMSAATAFLTAGELAEVRRDIVAVLDRHAERLRDRTARPEGAREVRLLLAASVVPPRPGRPETGG
jgi:DNA-binding MarR family transcriptional regulator